MEYALYIHIPFCTHRCAYCDFNTYAGIEAQIPAYVDAVCTELQQISAKAPRSCLVCSVYFGGGTPSLLSPDQIRKILSHVREGFALTSDAEISLEANPGTISEPQLRRYRELGVGRLSLGVQSSNGEELRLLERVHTFREVIEAVSDARRAGFENLNLDLIYGLPGQSMGSWQSTVQRILELTPDHISAYALTFEHGTAFGRWLARGLMPAPDSDLAADMYEWAASTFEEAGLRQYEISNWARARRTCRHNLQYWRGLPYLGVGAGAHGYASGVRYSNVLSVRAYIERLRASTPVTQGTEVLHGSQREFPLSSAAADVHEQSTADEMTDYMITGLRLTNEGISSDDFLGRFGQPLEDAYAKELSKLCRAGLLQLEKIDDCLESRAAKRASRCFRIRLTPRGRLLGNRVFSEFLA